MFAAIFHRAQAAVDTAVGQFVNRAIIAVPFIIAGGFATAALYMRLDREYGAETSTLIMSGLFAVLGLLSLAFVGRSSPSAAATDDDHLASTADEALSETQQSAMSDSDKDLLMAALASAAPVALPGLFRLALRNVPIIIAILAALFVMTRPPVEASSAEAEASS